ncbi:MAG: gliding motility-associated C-terminal domain-containing protein [Lentimicrobiaceae bacterium]|nr:gliding motility-associated C-terminal domain-containing protein [Lentimicrobiaceae bacterium]
MKRLLLSFLLLIMLMSAARLSYSQCNITITQPGQLYVTISGTTTICSGSTAIITVVLEGGTQPWLISYPGLGLPDEEIYDTDGTNDSIFVHTFTTPVLTQTTIFDSTNVVVTDPNNCVAYYNSSSAIVTVNPQAFVDAGMDASMCDADGAYAISGASASNTTSLKWTSSGDGSFDDNTVLNPVYIPGPGDIASGSVVLTLTGIGISPCPSAADDMILFISRMPVVVAGTDAKICNNTSYTVYDARVTNTSQYIWTHDGRGTLTGENTLTPTYIPASTESGIVTLTLTAVGEEPWGTVSDQMQIVIYPAVSASAGDNMFVCVEISNMLKGIVISGSSAENYSAIKWVTTGTGYFIDASLVNPIYNPSIADIENGMVTLIMNVYGIAPCSNFTDSITIFFSKSPVAFAGSDTSFCQGSSYKVTDATASNYSSIVWLLQPQEAGVLIDGNTLQPTFIGNANYSGTATLMLIVQGEGACSGDVATSTMQITVYPGVIVDAGEDQLVKLGTSTMLNGKVSGGSGFYSLNWTPSGLIDDNTIYNPTTTPILANTTYILTALDLHTGCMGNDEVVIYVDTTNRPPIAIDDYDTTFVDVPITIVVLNNDSDPDGDMLTVTSICANPLHGTVVINPDNTITYTPKPGYVGNDQFCYTICDDGNPALCSSAVVYITIEDLVVYNLLTGDGDGLNDYWHIRGIEMYPDNKVQVFNRWGDKVIELDNYDNANVKWRGTNEYNKPLPDGTYYYIIDLKARGKQSGWVYVRNVAK